MNLMVSIGIMALLLTVSVPYVRTYQSNAKLDGTARDLTADLRYAQQLTITEQIVHMIQLNTTNDNYQILKIDTATTTIKTVEFPAEVNFQQITNLTENQVIFNAYGAVKEAGTIILINNNGKTATIDIKPSGYIQLVL